MLTRFQQGKRARKQGTQPTAAQPPPTPTPTHTHKQAQDNERKKKDNDAQPHKLPATRPPIGFSACTNSAGPGEQARNERTKERELQESKNKGQELKRERERESERVVIDGISASSRKYLSVCKWVVDVPEVPFKCPCVCV